MGADIHSFVEVKKGKKWKLVRKTEKRTYGNGYSYEVDYYAYDSRNYNVFAILADVRNGRGFAGISTGEGFNPICDPKGMPKDASPTVKKARKEMGIDGHSDSWLTLKELLDYDWNQATKSWGYLSIYEYDRWKAAKINIPQSYSGAVHGPDIETLDEADYLIQRDLLKKKLSKKELEKTYVYCEFPVPYRETAEEFLEYVERMKELDPNPENVRMVFWFDN